VKASLGAALVVGAVSLAAPERWLHNPRERTAHALRAWESGDFTAARRALDQAREIGGGDALLSYNAGTGQLAAGAPGAALPLLQQAADDPAGLPAEQWRSLRPDALYNLGNAYLASDEPQAAADAYRACLRLLPEHQAAKHNLELALRRATGQPSPFGQQGAGGSGAGPPQPGAGGGQAPQQPAGGGEQASPEATGEGEAGRQGGAGGEGDEPRQGERGGARSPRLPGFAPQQDMSAEQAAALLEAVENLEREQRRQQAEELRRRARRTTEKDW
jgi:tetratricopeptide (TPR) repeat protein